MFIHTGVSCWIKEEELAGVWEIVLRKRVDLFGCAVEKVIYNFVLVILLELSTLTKADDALYSFPQNLRSSDKIPDGLKTIIEQCLCLDPASRPSFQSIHSTIKIPLAKQGLTAQGTARPRSMLTKLSTASPNTSSKDLLPQIATVSASSSNNQLSSATPATIKKSASHLKKANSGSQENFQTYSPSRTGTPLSPLIPEIMVGFTPTVSKLPEKTANTSSRALIPQTHHRNGGGGGSGGAAAASLPGQMDSFSTSINHSFVAEPAVAQKMERIKPASKEKDRERDRHMGGRSGVESHSYAGANSRGGGQQSINYSIHSAGAASNLESKSIVESEAEPQVLRMYGINPEGKRKKRGLARGTNHRGAKSGRRGEKKLFRMNIAIVAFLVLAVAVIIIVVLVKFAKSPSAPSSTSSDIVDKVGLSTSTTTTTPETTPVTASATSSVAANSTTIETTTTTAN